MSRFEINSLHTKNIVVNPDNSVNTNNKENIKLFDFSGDEKTVEKSSQKNFNNLGFVDSLKKNVAKFFNNNYDLTSVVNYFNSLDYTGRSDFINTVNDLCREKFYNLEKDINTAFENCEGYKLVSARPDRFESTTIFNLKEVHDDVETALNSLNELQKELEKAYDKAKNKENSEAEQVEYKTKLEEIAQTYLGCSYEEFVQTYGEGVYEPNQENNSAYIKAHEYVKTIKKLAREELQRTRMDSAKRLSDETSKYSQAMIEMIDFTDTEITAESILNLSSEIARESFIEQAQITEITQIESEKKKNVKKYILDGHVIIEKDGKKYSADGIELN